MKPHVLNTEHQPESFEFTKANKEEIKDILSRYPAGKQKSAVMPLLDLVQKQVAEEGSHAKPPYGGWIPRAAMDLIATIIGEAPMKVYEVATFYTMYKLAPVGKFNIQVCGTTPCWLRGAKDIQGACEKHLGIKTGESTKDGMFTLEEVECLGACVNAPMIQVNKDDYFEDLTPERMVEIIDLLRDGKRDQIPVGSQSGRQNSMAITGATTLKTTANDTKSVTSPAKKKSVAKTKAADPVKKGRPIPTPVKKSSVKPADKNKATVKKVPVSKPKVKK
jgi:NADH-quinone oxidoreductase subunit E